jgi:hypothetical protein
MVKTYALSMKARLVRVTVRRDPTREMGAAQPRGEIDAAGVGTRPVMAAGLLLRAGRGVRDGDGRGVHAASVPRHEAAIFVPTGTPDAVIDVTCE